MISDVVVGIRIPTPTGEDPGGTLVALARAAEELGVESFWTVEHVIVATGYDPRYPYSADGKIPGGGMSAMPDPLETLAFVAGATRTLKLGTSVVVGPLHSAAVLAKRAATLALFSGSRFLLGLGIGWQREEYAAVGANFERKGAQLDEMIGAMRALWGTSPASFDGEFTSFRHVVCEPRPPGGDVPVVIGGSSAAEAGRAGRLGDGWLPFVVSAEEFAAGALVVRTTAAHHTRDPAAIELTGWPGSYHAATEDDLDVVAPYVAAGARRLLIRVPQATGAPDDVERFSERIDTYKQRVLARL